MTPSAAPDRLRRVTGDHRPADRLRCNFYRRSPGLGGLTLTARQVSVNETKLIGHNALGL